MKGRRDVAPHVAVPRWYYVAAAFFAIDAVQAFHIVNRLVYGAWVAAHGRDKITTGLNILLILVGLILFAWKARGTRSIGSGVGLALAAPAFLLFSLLWSADPGETLRQGVVYLFVVVGSVGIASNLEPDDYMDLLARLCFWMAVASFALFVVSPAIAEPGPGDFQGIFSQKNVLGEAMTVGALASLHGLRAGNGRRLRSAIYLAGAIVLALMSESATSCLRIFMYCAASAAIVLIRRGGLGRFLAIVGIVLGLPAMLYLLAFPDALFAAIGKSPTLTGRTLLWAAVIPHIWQKPLLGWGFYGFWSFRNPAAVAIAVAFKGMPPQAHNGLLEMLLQVGVVGTAFFLFLLARTVTVAVRSLRTAEKELAISTLLSCAGIVMLAVSETVLLGPVQAPTSVFFITGLMCEKRARAFERRGAQRASPIRPAQPSPPGARPQGDTPSEAVVAPGFYARWYSRKGKGLSHGPGWGGPPTGRWGRRRLPNF